MQTPFSPLWRRRGHRRWPASAELARRLRPSVRTAHWAMAAVAAPLPPLVLSPKRPVLPTSPPRGCLTSRSPRKLSFSRPAPLALCSAREKPAEAMPLRVPEAPLTARRFLTLRTAEEMPEMAWEPCPPGSAGSSSSASGSPNVSRPSTGGKRKNVLSKSDRRMSGVSTQVGSDASLSEDPSLETLESLDGLVEPFSPCPNLCCDAGQEDACGGSSLCSTTTGASSDDRPDIELSRKPALAAAGKLADDGPRVRYYSQKLASWFQHAVDSEGTGQVRFRHFLAALRRHTKLQLILSKEAGFCLTEEEQRLFARARATGHFALPLDQRTAALLAERRRIKAVFMEMCGADCDAVEWEGFFGFFLRRGLVLDSPSLEDAERRERERRPSLLPAVVSAR